MTCKGVWKWLFLLPSHLATLSLSIFYSQCFFILCWQFEMSPTLNKGKGILWSLKAHFPFLVSFILYVFSCLHKKLVMVILPVPFCWFEAFIKGLWSNWSLLGRNLLLRSINCILLDFDPGKKLISSVILIFQIFAVHCELCPKNLVILI